MHKINHLLPVGIISLFCNCSQNHLIENNDEQFINIVAAVEKSIYGEESLTKGIISSVKDEITPTKEEETEASKEIQDAIFYIMQKSMTNFNKTRSEATLLSNDPNEMVGVFQVAAPGSGVVIQPANCGTYREFYFRMDCQDGGFTQTSGNVGTSSVDSNGNVHFKFCIVPRGNYGGGVLTFSDWQYHEDELGGSIISVYQDNEDSNNKNAIINTGGLSVQNKRIGPNFFGENTQWFWRYSNGRSKTLPFKYNMVC